jgi:hypothetical protein
MKTSNLISLEQFSENQIKKEQLIGACLRVSVSFGRACGFHFTDSSYVPVLAALCSLLRMIVKTCGSFLQETYITGLQNVVCMVTHNSV